MGLLDAYQDPALKVDLAMSAEQVTAQEVERLQAAVAMAAVAASIPRRISDASREELALDKRRSRRVLHPLRQCLAGWGGAEVPADAEAKRLGAQVDWPYWWEEHQVILKYRLRYVATWSKKTGNLRFGKSAVVKLSQELEWLAYALRD